MRYYLKKDILIVRGDFRAASNGVDGGLSDDAALYINSMSMRNGFLEPYFGLLTALPITNLCIARYDYVTVFVTAAVSDRNRTINIIVTCERPLADAALLGAMMTATEAKMQVIAARKLPVGALSTDAVVVACEKTEGIPETFAGPLTETGMRISKAVSHALTEALVWFDNYLLTTWGVTRGWSRETLRSRAATGRHFSFTAGMGATTGTNEFRRTVRIIRVIIMRIRSAVFATVRSTLV